jgi:hypothetical protein
MAVDLSSNVRFGITHFSLTIVEISWPDPMASRKKNGVDLG